MKKGGTWDNPIVHKDDVIKRLNIRNKAKNESVADILMEAAYMLMDDED